MLVKVARQIFEKCSNINFHESPSSGDRGVWCEQRNGQTDRQDEANSSFRNFANALNRAEHL